MEEKQLQAIEQRWAGKKWTAEQSTIKQEGYTVVFGYSTTNREIAEIAAAPTDISLLLAEVRRLRCCGNCRQQVGNPYFECAYMDIGSYNESGCKRCSEWEAADNG